MSRVKKNGDRHNKVVKDMREERLELAKLQSVPRGPTALERERVPPCVLLMGHGRA